MMNPSFKAIYGIIAKSHAGQRRMASDFNAVLPQSFPYQAQHWWQDLDKGVAIYSPDNPGGCLAGVGHLVTDTPAGIAGDLREQGVAAAVLQQIQSRGVGALDDISGEFSLLAWDGMRNELLLARDQVGQSGLYIREDEHHWMICSDMEPLIADEKFHCQMDLQSAVNYLTFGVPVNGRTLAKNVRKLRAGHYIRVAPGKPLYEQRYFTPLCHNAESCAGPELKQEIQATLDSAILSRANEAREEKSSAILLSGGIDSSYIAQTLTNREMTQGLTAYTIEFAPPCKSNETGLASEFARMLNIPHQAVFFDYPDVTKTLDKIVNAVEPCSILSSITHEYLLGEIQADGHDFLISGLGSDEIFGGYIKYMNFYSSMRLYGCDDAAVQAAAGHGVDTFEQLLWQPERINDTVFAGIPRFFSGQTAKTMLQPPFRDWDYSAYLSEFYRECRQLKSDAHLFELMVAHECQHRIPEMLLGGFDAIGRGANIRTVYPFLDKNLVRLATGLGATERFEVRNNAWNNKTLMREIAATRLPEAICERPRQAYVPPMMLWLAHDEFFDYIWSVIENSKIQELALIDPEKLPELKERVRGLAGTSNLDGPLELIDEMWVIFTLSAWYDRWVSKQ
ncbi:hypothetical protein SG34_031390 [Thalassomonas viridans]|uniref:asparagine synthase (glutamine-hydrolyzing) n=1 Tax=Thalassomonas viridans TaxID=137584 RepID=A0AAF0CEL5_9GAMM|nr:asparagine synthetase B family protein [Thalassomonas viridans]WDE09270.1 hypothetical protein SG34_031390 [Thalassomonas viridans]